MGGCWVIFLNELDYNPWATFHLIGLASLAPLRFWYHFIKWYGTKMMVVPKITYCSISVNLPRNCSVHVLFTCLLAVAFSSMFYLGSQKRRYNLRWENITNKMCRIIEKCCMIDKRNLGFTTGRTISVFLLLTS